MYSIEGLLLISAIQHADIVCSLVPGPNSESVILYMKPHRHTSVTKQAKQTTTVVLFFGFIMTMLLQCCHCIHQVPIAVMAVMRGLLCSFFHGLDDRRIRTCKVHKIDWVKTATHLLVGYRHQCKQRVRKCVAAIVAVTDTLLSYGNVATT